MSDDAKTKMTDLLDALLGSTNVPGTEQTCEESIAARNLRCVPEEWAARFTAVSINEGYFFGVVGTICLAGCNRCGALVYPTALDRHAKFHDLVAALAKAAEEEMND